MSKYQRDKGMRGQREVAALIKQYFPEWDPRSGAQYRKGSDNCDVEGTPFWIECKLGAAPSPRQAIKQAIIASDASNSPRIPVAFTRADKCEWFVTMHSMDFLEMVRRLEDYDSHHRTVKKVIEGAKARLTEEQKKGMN